jgi:hypothetical protein
MISIASIATGLQQIPNDVPWYYIVGAVVVGSAALSHGVSRQFSAWERELSAPKWLSVAGDITGIVLSIALSSFVGYLTWSAPLAGIAGSCGAFSSSLILRIIKAKLGVPQSISTPPAKHNEEPETIPDSVIAIAKSKEDLPIPAIKKRSLLNFTMKS